MQYNKVVMMVISGFIMLPVFSSAHAHANTLPEPNNTLIKKLKPQPLPLEWHPVAQFTFASGSLQKNIQHIAQQFGWNEIIWKAKGDYRWIGKVKFVNTSLPDILNKVLQSYPLQAVFYQGNHVLVISPRNIE